MPKTSKKSTAKASKSYAVIANADIRQRRGKRIPRGQAKESRETNWPPLWQTLIENVGGSYQTLAQLWDVSHMKVYRWGVEGREPSTLEKWGIREFCRTRSVTSPV
jgi:hypothetical protein